MIDHESFLHLQLLAQGKKLQSDFAERNHTFQNASDNLVADKILGQDLVWLMCGWCTFKPWLELF